MLKRNDFKPILERKLKVKYSTRGWNGWRVLDRTIGENSEITLEERVLTSGCKL